MSQSTLHPVYSGDEYSRYVWGGTEVIYVDHEPMRGYYAGKRYLGLSKAQAIHSLENDLTVERAALPPDEPRPPRPKKKKPKKRGNP